MANDSQIMNKLDIGGQVKHISQTDLENNIDAFAEKYANEKVYVTNSEGAVGSIPISQLKQALGSGYSLYDDTQGYLSREDVKQSMQPAQNEPNEQLPEVEAEKPLKNVEYNDGWKGSIPQIAHSLISDEAKNALKTTMEAIPQTPMIPGQTPLEYGEKVAAVADEIKKREDEKREEYLRQMALPETVKELDLKIADIDKQLKDYEQPQITMNIKGEMVPNLQNLFNPNRKTFTAEQVIKKNELEQQKQALTMQRKFLDRIKEYEQYDKQKDLSKLDQFFRAIDINGDLQTFAAFGLNEISKNLEFQRILNKAEQITQLREQKRAQGDLSPVDLKLTFDEQKALILYNNMLDIASKDRGIWFNAGAGMPKTFEFMRDIALAGIGGGFPALGKIGLKTALKQAGKSLAKKAGEIAWKTPLLPGFYSTLSENKIDNYNVKNYGTNENPAWYVGQKDSTGWLLYKSWAQQATEYFTESLGSGLESIGLLTRIAKGASKAKNIIGTAARQYDKIHKTMLRNSIGKYVVGGLDKLGINSFPMEFIEEIANVPLQSLALQENQMSQLADPRFYQEIAISTAAVGGVGSAVNIATGGATAAIERKRSNKAIKDCTDYINKMMSQTEDKKTKDAFQTLIDDLSSRNFYNEDGDFDGGKIVDDINAILPYVKNDKILFQKVEELVKESVYREGQTEALKDIVESEVGEIEYGTSGDVLFGADINGNRVFILGETDDAYLVNYAETREQKLVPKSDIVATTSIPLDIAVTNYFTSKTFKSAGLESIEDIDQAQQDVQQQVEKNDQPLKRGDKAMYDNQAVVIEDIYTDANGQAVAIVMDSNDNPHNVPLADLAKPDIITDQDRYMLPDGRRATVYAYDGQGNVIMNILDDNNTVVAQQTYPMDEMATFEKLPAQQANAVEQTLTGQQPTSENAQQGQQPEQPEKGEAETPTETQAVPRNEQGQIMWTAMPVERTVQEINSRFEQQDAVDYVNDMRNDAQKKVEKAEKLKPKSLDPDARAQELEAIKQQKAQAQANLDYWNKVYDAYQQQSNTAEQPQPNTSEQQSQTPTQAQSVDIDKKDPFRKRVADWVAKGFKITILESKDQVTNASALAQIEAADAKRAKGINDSVSGWFDPDTNTTYIYMPHVDNIKDIDLTIIHEVVAHKGLRALLGEERYETFCLSVWDSMSKEAQDYYMQYPGVNGNKAKAADEYIAYLAEKVDLTPEEQTIWDRIIERFRQFMQQVLDTIVDKNFITDEDIATLIRMSYANIKHNVTQQQPINDSKPTADVIFRRYDTVFNSELEDYKVNKHKGLLHLGHPGPVLKASGINANQLTLSPKVLNNHLNKHSLTIDDLKGLAGAIQYPILVYKHGKNHPNIVVVTDKTIDDKKLSISVELEPNGNVVEVNNISSVHKKDAIAELERLAKMGDNLSDNLRWVEKEKVLDWFNTADLISPIRIDNLKLDSITKLINDFENPTIVEDQSLNEVNFRATYTPEMDQIKAAAEKDGTFMKAPNGLPTKLNEQQWLQVRAEAFKNWFGDWINDPQNASKVVDPETGEPMVVYHGSPDRGINIFDPTKSDRKAIGSAMSQLSDKMNFFTDSKDTSEQYADYIKDGKPAYGKVYPVFLNIRNPKTINFNGSNWTGEAFVAEYYDLLDDDWVPLKNGSDKTVEFFSTESDAMKAARNEGVVGKLTDENFRIKKVSNFESVNEEVEDAINSGKYDGVIINNVAEVGQGRFKGSILANDYVTFDNPNQIKSATDNNGKFSTKNDDIRFRTNAKFNEDLQKQIDGILPKGYVYQLGMPGNILLSTGIANLPIQLNSTRLQDKSVNYGHNFNLNEIKDLVFMLNEPLAVFAYGDQNKSQNIVVELQKDDKHFIVGLFIKPTVNGKVLEINSIRNIFPKDSAEWLNWIAQGKALYLDKSKIQTLIDQQRTNLADVEYLDLDSITKLINDFENPTIVEDQILNEVNFRTTTGKEVSFRQVDITGQKLRKLKDGEFCHVERIFTESKYFDFTAGETIESANDVAYIFSQLEDESVENSFAVLVKDGKPYVIHVGMGDFNSTVFNLGAVIAADKLINADKIYMVHNHPSGQLKASRADVMMWNNFKKAFGERTQDGIIINLTTGKFGSFNDQTASVEVKNTPESQIPVKVYSFNKQVFDYDYDPQNLKQITGSHDVASFVSGQRLGDRAKISTLILSRDNRVVGNMFMPYSSTNMTTKKVDALAGSVVDYVLKMGGTSAIMYGSGVDTQNSKSLKNISDAVKRLSGDTIQVLDFIQIDGNAQKYESAMDEGVMFRRAIINELGVNNSLIGLHNISEDKLRKAIRQGGLANPSAAVINLNKQIHDNYGEISLIMPKSLVDKKTGKNAGTFIADAWTPTYPVVKKEMSSKGAKVYYGTLNKLDTPLKNRIALYFKNYLSDNIIYDALYYWYALDNGLNPQLAINGTGEFTQQEIDDVILITKGETSFWKLSKEQQHQIIDLYKAKKGGKEIYDARIKDIIEKLQSNINSLPDNRQEMVKAKIEMYQEYGVDINAVYKYLSSIDYVVKKLGEVSDYQTFQNAFRLVNEKGLRDDFVNRWLPEIEQKFDVKEFLYAGTDNRGSQKWIPNTLANASRLMNKMGLAGGTGTASFNHFVAIVAPKVTSLKQIQARKHNLSSEEEYEKFRKKWSDVYMNLALQLQPGAPVWEDYGEWRMEELANVANPKAFAKKEYNIELSDEFIESFNNLISTIKNDFPARYFETKFARPVMLDEFVAAVVPDNINVDIQEALVDAGLNVKTYKADNMLDRVDAIKQLSDSSVLFRYTPEMDKIKTAAEKDGTFMKAPNGLLTKLNEKQWLQVRTEAFKNWFGDWEKVFIQNFLKGTPIVSLTGEEIPQSKDVKFSQQVERYFGNNANEANSPFFGKIALDAKAASRSIVKGMVKAKAKAFASVKDVIEKGVIIDRQENYSGSGYERVLVAAPITIGNEDVICVVSLTGKDGNYRFDSHEVVNKKWLLNESSGAALWQPLRPKAVAKILKNLLSTTINASKVVDPETGEPMIVYHGTKSNFPKFDKTYNDPGSEGFYFTDASEMAESYGEIIMPVFLNIRDAYTVEGKGRNWNNLNTDIFYIIPEIEDQIRVHQIAMKRLLANGKITQENYDYWNNRYYGKVEFIKDKSKNSVLDIIKKYLYRWQIGKFKSSMLVDRTRDFEKILQQLDEEVNIIFNDITDYGPNMSDFTGAHNVYVTTKPNNIKSASDNNGDYSTKDDNIYFRYAPVFQSNALNALKSIKQDKATPLQWIAMLKNNGGLKAGEDKWIGLSDWLNKQDDTVTKQQILDYIKENQIIVVDEIYGQNGDLKQGLIDMFGKEYEKAFIVEEGDAIGILNRKLAVELYNKVAAYTYGPIEDAAKLSFEDWGNLDSFLIDVEGELKKNLKPVNSIRAEYTTDFLENNKEVALVVPSIEPWNTYDEVHFGDAGNGRAVAWVRFGETFDKDGKSVLVIDEVQSKRHQDAREKGYRVADVDKWLEDNNVEVVESGEFYEFIKDGKIDRRFPKDLLDYDIDKAKNLYVSVYNKSDIPAAPFEKNWHELAMKRMLRYAAENGYEKIAWTTGAQQAERYDLGHVVDEIWHMKDRNHFNLNKDGYSIGSVNIDKEGIIIDGNRIFENQIGNPLSDVVGKELANRMINSQPNDEIKLGGQLIGGEGMITFYDKMLVDFMNKYGKKWGVKVKDLELPHVGDRGLTMHSVEVTDSMKNSVLNESQVMFRHTADVVTPSDIAAKGLVGVLGQEKFDNMVRDIFEDLPLLDKAAYVKRGQTPSQVVAKLADDIINSDKVDQVQIQQVLMAIKDALIANGPVVLPDNADMLFQLWKGTHPTTAVTIKEKLEQKAQEDKIRFRANQKSSASTNEVKLSRRQVWQERLVDRMISLKEFYDQLKKLGIEVSDDLDPYVTENLAMSRSQTEDARFKDEIYEPLIAKVVEIEKMFVQLGLAKDLKDAYKKVSDFLYARHAPERNKQICIEEIVDKMLGKISKEEMALFKDENARKALMAFASRLYNEKYNPSTPQTSSTFAKNLLKTKGEDKAQQLLLKSFVIKFGGIIDEAVEDMNKIFKSEKGTNRSGMSDAEAKEIINNLYSPQTKAMLDKLSELVKQATHFTIDTWYKYSLINEKTKNDLKAMYKYYIPLRSWEEKEDIDYSQLTAPAFNRVSEILVQNRKAKGRGSKADDPLAYIASLAQSAIVVGNKNMIRLNLFRLIKNNQGVEGLDQFATLPKVYYVDLPDSNATIAYTERPAQELFDRGLVETKTNKAYRWHKSHAEYDAHIVPVIINGTRQMIELRGELGIKVASAVNNTNVLHWQIPESLRTLTNWLSAVRTSYNPEFVLTNFVRDFMFANLVYPVEGGSDKKLIINLGHAFKAIHRLSSGKSVNSEWDAYYQEFLSEGGQTGFFTMRNIDQMKKEIKVMHKRMHGGKMNRHNIAKNAKKLAEYTNNLSESAMRLAVYITERQNGVSPKQAAYKAHEISVNFNRKGTWSSNFGAFYSFFNASVQGTARLFSWANKYKKGAAAALTAIALTKLATNIIAAAVGGDDYDELSDYVKFSNIVIPVGVDDEGKTIFFCIPMAQGIRAVTNISDNIVDVLTGNKTVGQAMHTQLLNMMGEFLPLSFDAIDLTGRNTSYSFAVPFMPTAVQPLMDIWTNTDFKGDPIYKEPFLKSQEGFLPEFNNVYKGTSRVLVGVSKYLNRAAGGSDFRSSAVGVDKEGNVYERPYGYAFDRNPVRAEHLLNAYLGVFLTLPSNLVDLTISIFDPDEDVQARDLPVVNRFFKKSYKKDGYEMYYETKEFVDMTNNSISAARKAGDLKGAATIQKRNAEIIKAFKAYDERVKQLNELLKKADISTQQSERLEAQRDEIINKAAQEFQKIMKDEENTRD